MFSLCSNFFDFALLRQGQFLENDGEKSEEIKSKKYFKPAHTKSPFLVSLEKGLCGSGSGASPPTPPKKYKIKIIDFIFVFLAFKDN